MNTRGLALLGTALGVAVAIGLVVSRPTPEPAPAAAPALAGEAKGPEDSATPKPMTAEEWQTALGEEPEVVSEDALAPRPGAVVMPIEEKFAQAPLSEVAHQLVGAWDDAPESERAGAHRAIVAVVDPTISSTDLEQLVWDIREQHRDAEILDVRILDSAEAASRSAAVDGGAERATHVVADVKRNDRLGFDQTTVRGRVIAP